MFQNGITPEAIPERVYQLCKMVALKESSIDNIYDCLEPSSINKDRSYFRIVKTAAIDLEILRESSDKTLEFIVDKKVVTSLDNFRQYCNSAIWKDRDSLFYKMVVAFLSSDESLLKYNSITEPSVIQYIQTECNDSNADIKKIRGIRFWLEFLGLGYVQEKSYIYFLPNMYIALKDFMQNINFEKKREYSVREFIDLIKTVSNVAFEKIGISKVLNFAFSNALRLMHDRKEIELKYNLDSAEVWDLYKSDVHKVGNKITHIVYKEIK